MGPDGTEAEKENLLQSFSEVESMNKLMKEFQKQKCPPPISRSGFNLISGPVHI